MLRILGSRNRLHDIDRRAALHVGSLGAINLSLNTMLAAESESATPGLATQPGGKSFGRAKRILLVYLQGAASQFETWDPKPSAPSGIRGQLGATATAVPGTLISEGLPKLAQLTDRLALVRSMTHDHNNHSNLYTLTGHPAENFSSETNPFDNRHHPFFGSVLDYLSEGHSPAAATHMPRNIGLPFRFSSYSPFTRRSGPYGAFLGHGYDPVWTEFHGQATKTANRVSFFRRLKGVDVADPFLGITPESRLRLTAAARLRAGVSLDRLDKRRSLLEQFDSGQRQLNESRAGASVDRFQSMAYDLLTSEKLRHALDIGQEPMSRRAEYGMTLFGQSALTARRLLEAGCPLVSVFWDEYKVINTAWDTHYNHFTRMSNELLPGLDAGLSCLLRDLEDRGLLSETLVMCLSEHGRTPKINNLKRGGGRGHWSKVYSVMLAGAGIQTGSVIGASDKRGAFVQERPVSPEDILATMYHLKGIDPHTTLPDRLQRPVRLTERGSVIDECLV